MTLNWEKFDWAYFQRLVIHLAENLIPETTFEEYLKQGHKQEGIDLLHFNKKNGSFITIQCKRKRNLSKSDLEAILKEFLDHSFAQTSSQFILATSADLQLPKIQEWIIEKKIALKKSHNIDFDCWDRNFIEQHLQQMYNIVAHYFGTEIANRFCFSQLKHTSFPIIQSIPDAIPRKMFPIIKGDPSESMIWQPIRKMVRLGDLFTEDRLQTHHICLIGDAYQGKSSYLKQTAYELKESSLRIQPLLIEIKEYNVQPLEDLLTKLYGSWKNIPLKDIVLFVDGLDEAPTNDFEQIVRHINEFTLSYPAVSMVVSCRTLFYNLHAVNSTLKLFSFYELYPLEKNDINEYLHKDLGPLFSEFMEAINRTNLFNLLYHPFYLVNLAEEFKNPPHELPGNKLKIIDGVIERSFTNSEFRRLSNGLRVSQEFYPFKSVIQKLALCLQLYGKNSFDQYQIRQLFTREEIELLQHNSLITVGSETWSFSNALFQEHLAASLLAEMSYEQIIELIAVGKIIRKVKTKWIQTLSSLLSLLENESQLFQNLLHFIESDSIELIFQTEPSKYSWEFKINVFKKLIKYYKAQNIRPLLVHEETIASFIDGIPIAVKFL